MSRTITWDSSFPTGNKIVDQCFFNTNEKGFYRWNGSDWVSELFEEEQAINHTLALI